MPRAYTTTAATVVAKGAVGDDNHDVATSTSPSERLSMPRAYTTTAAVAFTMGGVGDDNHDGTTDGRADGRPDGL